MKHTTIIAEAGVNHNGSIEIAKQLIDVAAEAGADYIKFQTFKADALVSKNAQQAEYQKKNNQSTDQSQYEMLKKLELNEHDHDVLISYCKTKSIAFLSTAFDDESIALLAKKDLVLFKIPSGEITNLPYLQKIAAQRKPIILSTGMCSMDEIEEAISVLTNEGIDLKEITILHCNTEYPTPYQDVHLNAMLTIASRFQTSYGYSDHTLGIEVPIAAVALGASVIEKHITLDKKMEGPDHAASIEPAELKAMVKAIRHIEQALGSSIKSPSSSELKNRSIARKSIHLKKALQKNHVLSIGDLEMKRPGDGISPMKLNEVIGKIILHDLPAEHKLNLEDLSS